MCLVEIEGEGVRILLVTPRRCPQDIEVVLFKQLNERLQGPVHLTPEHVWDRLDSSEG